MKVIIYRNRTEGLTDLLVTMDTQSDWLPKFLDSEKIDHIEVYLKEVRSE